MKMRRSVTLRPGPILHSVNGGSLNVIGETQWKFDGCRPCRLVIVKECIQDCIIGIDFLRDADAQVIIGKNRVILYGTAYASRQEGLVANVEIKATPYDMINDVLQNFELVFSTELNKLGCCDIEPCHINTGSCDPIKQRPYRLPLTKRKIVDTQIQEMMDAGVIRPSSSPWASPVVLVPKKDGTTRFCIDYRKLNSVTKGDAYSLPSIQEIFDSMNGTTIFSTMDLTSGY